MLDAILIGTGGTMPRVGRWLSSFALRVGGKTVLIDCGEGTQIAMRHAGLTFKPIDVIFITHFHADHIAGLAGLLLSMGNEGRTEKVTILTPPGGKIVLKSLLIIAPELLFPIEVIELEHRMQAFSFCGLEMTTFPLRHNVPCWGASFYLPRKAKFDPDKAMRLGLPRETWSRLQSGETVFHAGRTVTPLEVLGAPRRGLRVTYATDTRPVPLLSQIGENSDLMVLEGMYGEADKLARAKETRHMTMQEAAKIAKDANAARLWLTHYSPSLPDPLPFLDDVRQIFPAAEAGFDGMTETLRFSED